MDAFKMSEDLSTAMIEELVRKFIVENYLIDNPDSLSEEESLLEKGIIDSTGILELVAFIERCFGIKIEDEELVPENLDSIANIIKYVYRKSNLGQLDRKGIRPNVASSIS